MKALLSRLAQGDGVLDVGANVGDTAGQFAARVGPLGHVLAVEPNPDAAAKCRRALAAQPWARVREVAVDEDQGTVALHVSATSTHSSLAAANVAGVLRAVDVPAVTLDALAEEVANLKAIKIDAQGAEVRILRGAERCLLQPRLLWMVEFWPAGLRACGSTVETFIAAFASAGWRLLATGKLLDGPALSWDALAAQAATMHGHAHTNLLIGRSTA